MTDHTTPNIDDIDEPTSVTDFLSTLSTEDDEFAEALSEAEPLRLLATIVTDLRNLRGLTQKELAERIGKQQPAIARIENASVNSGWETVSQILHALRVNLQFTPAEVDLVAISREEFEAHMQAAEQKGFANGMVRAAALQGVRHANFAHVGELKESGLAPA